MGILIAQMTVNALMLAGFYILIGSGLTLLLGSIKILTLAQGAMCMLGSYGLYYFFEQLNLPYSIAMIITIVIVGSIGVAYDGLLLRKYRQKFLAVSNITLGVWLIAESGIGIFFGTLTQTVEPLVPGLLKIGQVVMPWERIIMLLAATLLTGLLFVLLYYTKPGRGIRAYGYNQIAAELQGVRGNRIAALAMFVATGYAGVAGLLAAPIFSFNPNSSLTYLMNSVTVVSLGGLGSIQGAVIASLLLGAIYSFIGTLAGSTVAYIVGFAVIIIVLAIRPSGLMGVEYELQFE